MATDVADAPATPVTDETDKDVTPAPTKDAPVAEPTPTDAPATPEPTGEPKEERLRGPDGKFIPKESKDTKDAPVVPGAPEKYELALPKDAALPVASIERTAALARTLGLSNDAAQQMLNAVNAEATAFRDAMIQSWEPQKGDLWIERNTAWKDAARKDPEIGGTDERLSKSVELGNQVLRRFFPADVSQELIRTGWASNPGVLKGLAKIGRAMSEGSLVTGGAPAGGTKTLEERLYGPKDAAA